MFGRSGARPFTYDEMLRMLRTNDGRGDWFRVVNEPRMTQIKSDLIRVIRVPQIE